MCSDHFKTLIHHTKHQLHQFELHLTCTEHSVCVFFFFLAPERLFFLSAVMSSKKNQNLPSMKAATLAPNPNPRRFLMVRNCAESLKSRESWIIHLAQWRIWMHSYYINPNSSEGAVTGRAFLCCGKATQVIVTLCNVRLSIPQLCGGADPIRSIVTLKTNHLVFVLENKWLFFLLLSTCGCVITSLQQL